MRRFLALLSVVAVFSVTAAEIVGTVIKVSDGDTIWVNSQSAREKVRLDRIDAPESNQAYGTNATESEIVSILFEMDARLTADPGVPNHK